MEPAYQPCPACPNVVELRVSDFLRWPMRVNCPACGTHLYFNFRKKGGELFIPGLLILFGFLFFHISQGPQATLLTWQFAAVVLVSFLVTQVLIALFGRSRVPLQTKEEARTVEHCPLCKKGLDSSAFRRPWNIECPHCHQRLQATWGSHLTSTWLSLYAGLVMVRLGSQYLPLSEVEFWVAVCGVGAIYYGIVSRHALRLKRPAEGKAVLS